MTWRWFDVGRKKIAAIPQRSRIQSTAGRDPGACLAADDRTGGAGKKADAAPVVANLGSLVWSLLLAWLILAQLVHWSTPVFEWIALLLVAVVAMVWCHRAGWPVAIRAVIRGPLSPLAAAAVLSALANGGDYGRALLLMCYAVLVAWMLDRSPDLDRALVGLGWPLFGLCLLEWLYLVEIGGAPARVHLWGNPNVIACVLVIVWVVGYGRLSGWRWWLWVAVGIMAIGTTGSRAAALGVIAFNLARLRVRWWVIASVLVLAGLGLMIVRPAANTDRLIMYKDAIRIFADHVLAGVGPGRYRSMRFIHAHNLILTVAAEMGMIGLFGLGAGAFLVTRHVRAAAPALVDLSPFLAVVPFWIVDDMAMWWFCALGALYLFAKVITDQKN